jgi:hypothetical protein
LIDGLKKCCVTTLILINTGLAMADISQEKLLDIVAKDKSVPNNLIEELMDNIMRWESDMNKSQIIPNAIQQTNSGNPGPGRGAFQFELSTLGGSGAAKTARNRLKAYLTKQNIAHPSWLANLADNYDPSTLSLDKQKMLFLGDAAEAGNKRLGDLVGDNPKSFGQWWADNHKVVGASQQDINDFDNLANTRRQQRLQSIPIDISTSRWVAG